MCPIICPRGGKSMTDDWPDVTLDYEVQSIGSSFMSTRTIETPEDADRMLDDYLPSILSNIYINIRVNGEVKYKYVLEPKDYAVRMVSLMKHQMLREVKACIERLQQYVEQEEAE